MGGKSQTFFTVRVAKESLDAIPLQLFVAAHDDLLFVSATGRLCSFSGRAKIESRRMSDAFAKCVIVDLSRRHGEGIQVEVVGDRLPTSRGKEKIASDTRKVQAYLEACGIAFIEQSNVVPIRKTN